MFRRRLPSATLLLTCGATPAAATGLLAQQVRSANVAETPRASVGLVDVAGTMRLPLDYRAAYQFLGTWAVASDTVPGSKEMHTVYVSPGAIDEYRANGRFKNGTVLVKEVFNAESEDMTTGRVSRAAGLAGWFMMVKDDRGSYPGNPLWGDGWGWAWFDKGSPDKTKTLDYRQECLGCHTPAQATDWLYVKGYPVLAR